MRKIIQFSTFFDKKRDEEIIYALCDDGSLWIYRYDRYSCVGDWDKVSQIPQDDEIGEK